MGAAGQKEDSMPLYELGLLLSAELETEARDAFLEELRQIITAEGATITKEDVWGRRNLAYLIGHKREGYYVFWQYDGPGSVVKPLEFKLRLSDQVMRFIHLNLDREMRRSRKMEKRRKAAKARKAELAAEVAAAGAQPVQEA
jgi:small subunit ribosomal protein S6